MEVLLEQVKIFDGFHQPTFPLKPSMWDSIVQRSMQKAASDVDGITCLSSDSEEIGEFIFRFHKTVSTSPVYHKSATVRVRIVGSASKGELTLAHLSANGKILSDIMKFEVSEISLICIPPYTAYSFQMDAGSTMVVFLFSSQGYGDGECTEFQFPK